MMILTNYFSDIEKTGEKIPRKDYEILLKILAPFAPHLTEEIWQGLGHENSIHSEPWPEYDENALKTESRKIGVQINGKVRFTIEVVENDTEESVKAKILLEKPDLEIKGIRYIPLKAVILS
jgi:leucyl-tRNA synthetase